MSKSNTETVEKKDKSAKPAKPGIFARLSSYFHDVKVELKRVVWPSKPEIVNSSVVVMITLVFFIVVIYLIDAAIVPILVAFSNLGS